MSTTRASSPPCLPASLSPVSSLEGAWIEIFKAGDYGDRGAWSPEDLDRLAASYNPRLQAAPVVLGHPADDAPAYGWVRGLRRAGASLWAQLEKVDPAFEVLLRAGRFRQRSVALYTHFPPTNGPYLRHLGFLGAAPPAVKALAPVRFVDCTAVSFAFESHLSSIALNPVAPLSRSRICGTRDSTGSLEESMPETKSTLENFFNHLRAFFAPDSPPSTVIPTPPPAGEGSAFSDRLAFLEQRLDSLAAEKKTMQASVADTDQARRREQVAHFVESLRRRGRFPPVFDHWGVPAFLERLAAADAQLPSGSGDESPEASGDSSSAVSAEEPLALHVWFQDFLTRLPAVIDFREFSTSHPHEARSPRPEARLVSFTEPQRGMTIDPASIELAERAEALAAELGITYAEALTQLREEHRHSPTTA